MKTIKLLFVNAFLLVVFVGFTGCIPKTQTGLKDAFKNKFLMGVAMNADQIMGKDFQGDELILKNFNSIVAENCMKSEVLQPVEGEFDFSLSDQFVDFGLKHKMFIVGHTLIWHSQAPSWFFVDSQGNAVSREVMIERMKAHITKVVSRYKGKVNGWDVVNEAFNDDGTWRESPFYKIIGKDYVKLAFQFAHEADPQAELYYNDYNMGKEGKRKAVVQLINELKNEGIRVDGIGMQGHMTMDYPAVEDYEKSIDAFSSTGAKVMVTEMDITVLPFPQKQISADVAMKYKYDSIINPYYKELPDSVAQKFDNRIAAFFQLFLKHQKQISRVTMWGLSDATSWKNNWPVQGRTDYPLLFDRNNKPKKAVKMIINEANKY